MSRPQERYAPVRVTGPATLPVTLGEARAYCRSEADDDGLIEGLIGAVVEGLDGPDGKLGRCLMPQTWRQPFRCFADRLQLPFPAIDVVEVAYLDANSATEVVDPSVYRLEDAAGRPHVVRSSASRWPETLRADRAAVSVTFTAGFADGVPAPIRSAILLEVRRAYGAVRAGADLKKEVVEGVGSQEWDVSGVLDGQIADVVTRMLAPFLRVGLL